MRTLFGVLLLIAAALTALAFLLWGALGLFLMRADGEAAGGGPLLVSNLWLQELVGAGIAAAALLGAGVIQLRGGRQAVSDSSEGSANVRRGGGTVVLLCLVAACAFFGPIGWSWREYNLEREREMLPPPLLTAEQTASLTPLFDGQSDEGWMIEGPAKVTDGTLEIGGDAAASGRISREFHPGDTIQFHFKHVGPGHHPDDAKLFVEPILGDEADVQTKYAWQQPPDHELRQSGLTPIGGQEIWHEAIIRTHYENGEKDESGRYDYTLELRQRIGQEGGPQSHHGATSAPISFRLRFQTSPGNRLLLRNVYFKARE